MRRARHRGRAVDVQPAKLVHAPELAHDRRRVHHDVDAVEKRRETAAIGNRSEVRGGPGTRRPLHPRCRDIDARNRVTAGTRDFRQPTPDETANARHEQR